MQFMYQRYKKSVILSSRGVNQVAEPCEQDCTSNSTGQFGFRPDRVMDACCWVSCAGEGAQGACDKLNSGAACCLCGTALHACLRLQRVAGGAWRGPLHVGLVHCRCGLRCWACAGRAGRAGPGAGAAAAAADAAQPHACGRQACAGSAPSLPPRAAAVMALSNQEGPCWSAACTAGGCIA